MHTQSESRGTRLELGHPGQRNVITSTIGRIATGIKTADQQPEKLAEVGALTRRQIDADPEAITRSVAVIHDVEVELVTDSPHLTRQFELNWFTSQPDRPGSASGAGAHRRRVTAYALVNMPGVPQTAVYSEREATLWFINLAFYGQVKSWILGAVARVLAADLGVHSIHGSCIEIDGRGLLMIAPSGTGKTTSTYGLMQLPGARRLHSDDWVFLRYFASGEGGEELMPVQITELDGHRRRGSAMWQGVLAGELTDEALLQGLDREGRCLAASRGEIDLAAPLVARAHISERSFYVRTNLLASFPEVAEALFAGDLENVPPLDDALGPERELLAEDLLEEYLGGRPELQASREALTNDFTRLIAREGARAMIPPERLFRSGEVVTDPEEGVALSAVVLLSRDPSEERLLERLDERTFVGRLLEGRTPAGTFDTAYNAYRLVDDEAERRYIEARIGDHQALLDARSDPRAPQTLREEATMLSLLWRSTRAYSVNTILVDRAGMTLREAARLTAGWLEEIVTEQAPDALELKELPLRSGEVKVAI
jgi:hypothetical protein